MKQDRDKIYVTAKIALCVSLMSVTSWFVLPVPVSPVVLSFQTVAVGLTALILSPGQCAWAMVLYLVMGALGLPVFSGGTSGIGKLLGPTGGFYFGFLLSAIAISLLKGKKSSFLRYTAVSVGLGIPLQHLCAVLMMCIHNGGDISSAFFSVSVPFIFGDILKALATSYLGIRINKIINTIKH